MPWNPSDFVRISGQYGYSGLNEPSDSVQISEQRNVGTFTGHDGIAKSNVTGLPDPAATHVLAMAAARRRWVYCAAAEQRKAWWGQLLRTCYEDALVLVERLLRTFAGFDAWLAQSGGCGLVPGLPTPKLSVGSTTMQLPAEQAGASRGRDAGATFVEVASHYACGNFVGGLLTSLRLLITSGPAWLSAPWNGTVGRKTSAEPYFRCGALSSVGSLGGALGSGSP